MNVLTQSITEPFLLPENACRLLTPDRNVRRSVLIASKGDASSRAAARVARELVGGDTEVRVLAVDDPLAVLTSHARLADVPRTSQSLAASVRQQLDGCGCIGWPIEVRHGDAAATICHAANDFGASLVVIGLNEHGVIDRALHRETTLRVLRQTQTPVLAVVPWAMGRPRVILAGIDFSPASVRAVRIAAALAADNCHLILVHVMAPVSRRSRGTLAFSEIVSRGADDAMRRLARDLVLPAGGRAEWMVVRGEAGPDLSAIAARAGADLVAVGARPGGEMPTVVGPSVRAALVRDASRSVLVAPGKVHWIAAA